MGRPGSGALPTPTARPLGGLPVPVWGVRGRALSHPQLPALRGGCWGRCGASGVGRSPTPDCSPSGRAAGAGVGRPGSDALPTPTARPLGGLPGPVWGVRGRTLSHPRLLALWAGYRGRCGASRVGRSPTPDCPPSGRAAGAGVGRPGSGALPPPTARPLGGLPGPVWGVRGRALSHSRLPALWAGCRGRCGASGVGRSPTPDCPPFGRAARAGVGRRGSGALPPPTARPSGGLPGCCACACPAWPGRADRPPGRVLVRLTFPLAFLASLFACSAPSGLGLPSFVVVVGFFCLLSHPPLVFFSFFFPFPPPPLCAPLSPALRVFRLGVPWALASCCLPPPPFLFFFLGPPPLPVVSGFSCFPVAFGLCAPPPLFFSCPAARLLCVFWGVVLCVPCPARSLCCARRLCCFWWLVLLVPGVAAFCWGSAGGSGCPALSFGGVCRLWCPCLVWPTLGVLPVVSRSPVLCPVALCCRVVLCYGALSSFFFVFLPAGGAGFLLFPSGSGLRASSGSFLFLCSACGVLCWCACAVAPCSVLSCPRGAGWCFVLLPVVFVCLLLGLAVLCCLPVGPGGSWCRVSVACCGVSPGSCASPCCCALRRLALRCCALCCFVLLRLVLPRAVLCPGALSFVLGSCAFWRRVLPCLPALCVFCCGVSLRGVVRCCALCRVRPGLSCCAFLVVSALCGVAVWPALPRCPASLCCAPWCCAAAWCLGVLSCRLAGFVSCVGVVVPT